VTPDDIPEGCEWEHANAVLRLLASELEAGRLGVRWALERDAPGGCDWVAWAWRYATDEDPMGRVLERIGRLPARDQCGVCAMKTKPSTWWLMCPDCAQVLRDQVPALTLAEVLAVMR
jgi:hypothetical protein